MKIPQLHKTKIFISLLLSTTALSGCAKSFSQTFLNESPSISQQWQVVRVSDGDTIAVRQGVREMKIRFCGIDAPEKAQPLGKESKANLQKLVNEVGGKVMVSEVERDRYGRTVAEVFSSKNGMEKFWNEEQLTSGNAYFYKQYASSCPNKDIYEKAEAIAQSKRLGVWGGNYQKPWDYRRQQRSR
jgi:micrococcal nuclease